MREGAIHPSRFFSLYPIDQLRFLSPLPLDNGSRLRPSQTIVCTDWIVNRNGIMEVLNVQSGELAWRERLPLGSKVHSGITLAGGLLYVGNEKGSHLVLRPGSSYEEVARNELGEQIDASPVFFGDRLYLRGEKHLFCISNE